MTRRSPLLSAASAVGAAALLLPSPALRAARPSTPWWRYPRCRGWRRLLRLAVRTTRTPTPGTRSVRATGIPPPTITVRYYYDNSASLQLQVTPRQTEVFVDGHFAGVVDDFDGTFQRLHVEPGEHELQLFLPGHKSVTQHVYVQPRSTFRVKYTMEPLGPGEPEPVRPAGTSQEPPRPRPASGQSGGTSGLAGSRGQSAALRSVCSLPMPTS